MARTWRSISLDMSVISQDSYSSGNFPQWIFSFECTLNANIHQIMRTEIFGVLKWFSSNIMNIRVSAEYSVSCQIFGWNFQISGQNWQFWTIYNRRTTKLKVVGWEVGCVCWGWGVADQVFLLEYANHRTGFADIAHPVSTGHIFAVLLL